MASKQSPSEPSPAPPPPPPPPDQTEPETTATSQPERPRATFAGERDSLPYYNWRTLFKCLAGNCTPHEREMFQTASDIHNEARDCKRCEKWRDWNYAHSPTVRFLRSELQTLGTDLPPSKVYCLRCPHDRKGGFESSVGIMLCANHITRSKQLEDTLAHELVHAYDHLRWEVDPRNLRHQACTEIRATMLSGECRWQEEWWHRRQFSLMGSGMGQFQDCVRRRAELSVAARPDCKDIHQAKSVVKEVWESCFRDTRPFDEIYR